MKQNRGKERKAAIPKGMEAAKKVTSERDRFFTEWSRKELKATEVAGSFNRKGTNLK